MDVSADVRACLAEVGDAVTLQSGTTVYGLPGLASAEDTLTGDTRVTVNTRTLRFSAADVPTLVSGQTLTWSGKNWRVIQIQHASMGAIVRAFLGSAA